MALRCQWLPALCALCTVQGMAAGLGCWSQKVCMGLQLGEV